MLDGHYLELVKEDRNPSTSVFFSYCVR